MATIGSLSVQLTADGSAFVSGLAAAEKKAESFAKGVGKLLSAPFEALKSFANSPPTGLSSFVAPIHDMVSSIPLIGGALGAVTGALGGFLQMIEQTGAEMASTAKQAKNLGFETETFSALMAKAGPHSEDLAASLSHFSRTMGELKNGSKETATAIDRLFGPGSAAQFEKGTNTENLKLLADNISRIKDPAQQAAAAMQFFGKNYQDVLKEIKGGSGNIEEVVASMKQKGLAFDDSEVASILEAQKAFREIGQTIEGIKRTLASALGPLIKEIGEGITSWAKNLNVKEAINDLIESLLSAADAVAGFVVDAINKIKDLAAEAENAVSLDMVNPFHTTASANRLEKPGSLLEGFRASRGGGGGGDFGPAIDQENIAKLNAISQSAADFTKQLQIQAKTFGMTADQAKIYEMELEAAKLSNNAGARAAIEQARAQVQKNEAIAKVFSAPVAAGNLFDKFEKQRAALHGLAEAGADVGAAMQKLGKDFEDAVKKLSVDIWERNRTELEKFKSSMQETGKSLADEATKNRDRANQFLKLRQTLEGKLPGQLTAPQALEKGSAAELSARNQFERQNLTGTDIQGQIKAVLEAAKMVQDAQLQRLGEIADALKNQDVIPAADLGL